MEIGCIPDHRRISGVDPGLQTDVRGERSLEEFEGFDNDRLDIHRYLVAEAAAAESQDAFDQKLCTLGRMHDVVEVAPQLALCSTMLKREFAVPQNCPKDVIEVMGNPAGERADCLHLLRLPQLG